MTRPSHGAALLERRATLEPSAASPGRARRMLRDLLSEAQHEEWLDSAELALSEVVTNAALHAHTTIEVRVGVFEDEVCVEVLDGNPLIPLPRDYDAEATTGRGMGLVAALCRSCGVDPIDDAGKVVWFCVGDDTGGPDANLAARWNIDDLDIARRETDRIIQLRSMPATLWFAARQHHDALLRELVLFFAEHPRTGIDLASADAARQAVSYALVAEVEQARREGRAEPAIAHGNPSALPAVPAHLDLEVCVPTDAAPGYSWLQDVLDMGEALAVQGELLIRPGLPEIIAVRDWVCEQVIAQLAGSPPAPWPGTADERFETTVHDRAHPDHPDWDASVVNDATTAVIAGDDANRIIAVSDPCLDLLGWTREALVGRRVVTVVPPSLREAHVAGFSRHISTGQSHVLGVPLTLPVLHRDGHEIPCRFLVDRAPDAVTRAVYVATLTPLDDRSAAPSDGS